MQQACLPPPRPRGGKDLGTHSHIRTQTDMAETTAFAGVALLTLAAPFELTEPLLRLPRQSVSSLELAIMLAFAGWGATLVFGRFPVARLSNRSRAPGRRAPHGTTGEFRPVF